MTRINREVLALFFGSLGLVIAFWGLVDYFILVERMPSGSTISWSLALLGAESPMACATIGFITGGVIFGLFAHFWTSMISPSDFAELVALRAQVAQLQGDHTPCDDCATRDTHPKAWSDG